MPSSEELIEQIKHKWTAMRKAGDPNSHALAQAALDIALARLHLAGEAVAWAYYHDGQMDGPWHPVVARTRWRHPVSEPWTEVPLFAHPALTASERREAAARAERDRLIANPGAERYWEGRWRDADAEIELLTTRIADKVAAMPVAEHLQGKGPVYEQGYMACLTHVEAFIRAALSPETPEGGQ